jgi:hypothetical protein
MLNGVYDDGHSPNNNKPEMNEYIKAEENPISNLAFGKVKVDGGGIDFTERLGDLTLKNI